MSTITIQLSGPAADKLRHLVDTEGRSEVEIVRAALEAYTTSRRVLPKGTGKYRSGRKDVSEKAEEILRQAVREGQWP